MAKVGSVEVLRKIIGSPNQLVPLKIHRQLNARAIEFISKSPMLMLATSDAAGQPTVSPKGDLPGFVQVTDSRTLLIPERKGNKLIFSLSHILENAHVGLIFLVPGTSETLRVQGNAELIDDPEQCATLAARGSPALLITRVTVTECYFHCAKAFLRSNLWRPETWPEKMPVSFGEEIAESGGLPREAIAEFDISVGQRYKTDL